MLLAAWDANDDDIVSRAEYEQWLQDFGLGPPPSDANVSTVSNIPTSTIPTVFSFTGTQIFAPTIVSDTASGSNGSSIPDTTLSSEPTYSSDSARLSFASVMNVAESPARTVIDSPVSKSANPTTESTTKAKGGNTKSPPTTAAPTDIASTTPTSPLASALQWERLNTEGLMKLFQHNLFTFD